MVKSEKSVVYLFSIAVLGILSTVSIFLLMRSLKRFEKKLELYAEDKNLLNRERLALNNSQRSYEDQYNTAIDSGVNESLI